MNIRPGIAVAVIGATLLGCGAWLVARLYTPQGGVQVLAGPTANFSLLGAAKGASSPAESDAPAALNGRTEAARQEPTATLLEVRDMIQADPAFKGLPPAGDCAADRAGRLLPDVELRYRFDHFWRLAEHFGTRLPRAELRMLVEADACPGRDADTVSAMLALWDNYLRVQTWPYRYSFSSPNPLNWVPAFEERKRVRREVLGQQWGDAFYAGDEAVLTKLVATMTGQVKADPPPDPRAVPQSPR